MRRRGEDFDRTKLSKNYYPRNSQNDYSLRTFEEGRDCFAGAASAKPARAAPPMPSAEGSRQMRPASAYGGNTNYYKPVHTSNPKYVDINFMVICIVLPSQLGIPLKAINMMKETKKWKNQFWKNYSFVENFISPITER